MDYIIYEGDEGHILVYGNEEILDAIEHQIEFDYQCGYYTDLITERCYAYLMFEADYLAAQWIIKRIEDIVKSEDIT